jgi:D-glycero-alpha-D-manno-heptose-7-phosphate kinase
MAVPWEDVVRRQASRAGHRHLAGPVDPGSQSTASRGVRPAPAQLKYMQGDVLTVRASAPTRMCDNGGWTDTWFAEFGTVFSIAIEPRVHVELVSRPQEGSRPPVVIDARAFGDRYTPDAIEPRRWGLHPLLEASIAEVSLPADTSVEITIESTAPQGASIGTSAAACVALIGALDVLTPGRLTAADVARAAWRVETVRLGQQSGVQDQLAAAFGGINLIHIDDYPDARVTRLDISPSITAEVERRTLLVYLGAPHDSSAIHEEVIAQLSQAGGMAAPLAALREMAQRSADALLAGDLEELGRVMTANTEAQRQLHHRLVSPRADRVITAAMRHGALGYKVNGAGGDGGTITLLTIGDPTAIDQTVDAVASIGEGCRILPFRLASDGLRVESQ